MVDSVWWLWWYAYEISNQSQWFLCCVYKRWMMSTNKFSTVIIFSNHLCKLSWIQFRVICPNLQKLSDLLNFKYYLSPLGFRQLKVPSTVLILLDTQKDSFQQETLGDFLSYVQAPGTLCWWEGSRYPVQLVGVWSIWMENYGYQKEKRQL